MGDLSIQIRSKDDIAIINVFNKKTTIIGSYENLEEARKELNDIIDNLQGFKQPAFKASPKYYY